MKKVLALTLTLILVLGMIACGSGKKASSNKLTVYTAFPETEVINYFNAFEKETGIKIEYVRLSAGEMLTKVEAEKDNPQAALMLGGSTDNYINAVDKGLFEKYQSPELANTPANSIRPERGTRSTSAASHSHATRTGSRRRAMSIRLPGKTCSTRSTRARSSWRTRRRPARHTPSLQRSFS